MASRSCVTTNGQRSVPHGGEGGGGGRGGRGGGGGGRKRHMLVWDTILMSYYLLLVSSPCSGGQGSDTRPRVVLRGAGASFPKEVYSEWLPTYASSRREWVNIDMTYDPIGSTRGKEAIMGKGAMEVEYAGTDEGLTTQERVDYPDLMLFPTMAGAVVIGYNLELGKNKTLTLSLQDVVGIYNGTYQNWNDSAFRLLNPDVTFPDEEIVVLVRSDGSGTTYSVTSAFCAVPSWNQTYGRFSDPDRWNQTVVHYKAQKTRGMSGLILSFKNSIGYLVVSDANRSEVQQARLVNQYGRIVPPSGKSVQLAMDEAAKVMKSNLVVLLSEHQGPNTYPIASFTYMAIKLRTMENCRAAVELLRYIYWFMYDVFPSESCLNNHMVPLSASIKNRVKELVLLRLECKGERMWYKSLQDKKRENNPPPETRTWFLPTMVGVGMLFLFAIAVVSYFTVQQIKRNRILDRSEWDVPIEDIIFYTTSKCMVTGQSRFVMWPSVTSLTDIDDIEDGFQMVNHILQWPGKWDGHTIGLRLLEMKGLVRLRRSTKKILLSMRDDFNHTNILRFYGLAELQSDRYVVSDYCSKGPLRDILKDDKYVLNKDFKFSVSLEVLNGLGYLHSKSVVHGSLRSASCLIDFKWTIKIADWEYCYLYSHVNSRRNPLLTTRKTLDEIGKDEAAFLDFWVAPELIKSDRAFHPTTSSDIYSYAIILQEIFTRRDPYIEHADTLSYSELLKRVINNNLRPAHGCETPTSVRQIMEIGWSEVVTNRPSIDQILKMMRGAHSLKKTVLDTMMEATEEYTVGLEGQLKEAKDQLSTVNNQLKCLSARTIPPYLERKLTTTSGRSGLVSSAHVIALKMAIPDDLRGDSEVILKTVHALDTKIEEICQRFGAFKIDCTCGIYLLILGIAQKDKRNALNAAMLAVELTKATNFADVYDNSTLECSGQCAITHGDVYSGLVQNSATKCFILGKTLEMSQKLLSASQNLKVLMSENFMLSLNRTKTNVFCWEENKNSQSIPHLPKTYWLSYTTSDEDTSQINIPNVMLHRSRSEPEAKRSDSSLTPSQIPSRRHLTPGTHTKHGKSRKQPSDTRSIAHTSPRGVTLRKPEPEQDPVPSTSGNQVSRDDLGQSASFPPSTAAISLDAKNLESRAISSLRELLTLSLPKSPMVRQKFGRSQGDEGSLGAQPCDMPPV